jgi:glycosyltransferase involved in cell wall biosynthesis
VRAAGFRGPTGRVFGIIVAAAEPSRVTDERHRHRRRYRYVSRMDRISIITPTYNRSHMHEKIFRCFLSQNYPDLEWLVLDDSAEVSPFFQGIRDPRIMYRHIAQRLSIGAKRNWLAEQASGEIIVHFDDDDHYNSNYVSSIAAAMQSRNADLFNMRGWFVYDRRHDFFGYWNLLLKEGLHYVCDSNNVKLLMLSASNNAAFVNNHLGFGFGWAYKKQVWKSGPFPDQNWNEDGEFALKAQAKFNLDGQLDVQGICLHVLHPAQTSRCFPQFHMPSFLLAKYFPQFEC